jgi:hypothetical protein
MLSRDAVETAIKDYGFQPWRLSEPALAPEQASLGA